MNKVLHAIIEDYFTITGRPIATLTVDEYIRFQQQYSGQLNEHRNIAQEVDGGGHESNEPDTRERLALSFESGKSSEPKQPVSGNPAKPDKEAMLRLMQSISS